ncbi:lipopolysaccharide biosynthesis protein [Hydrogenophaga sp.]|uniref:lipopolysaccharide biosynthesis protein n=1 Tax=Hydrogenophaga sp. TaxID=1904254 RepID=UPI0035B19C7D
MSLSFERLRQNLTRLTSGSILAQIVLAISTPLLTRLYAPEAFGLAALFSAAYTFLIPIITLKYDQAIILPKSHKSASSIGAMVIFVGSANCILLGLGLIIYLNAEPKDYGYSFLLLPVALWFGMAYTLMQQWSSRVSNYTYFSQSQVLGAFANVAVCTLAAITFTTEPIYLVVGSTTGIACALSYTIGKFRIWPYHMKLREIRSLKKRISLYRNFPTLVLPATLITVAGSNGTTFVLSHFYSIEDVGVFAVANRVLLAPAAIIGGALAEAVRSEFAARQRDRSPVSPVFRRIFFPILLLAVFFFGLIFLIPSSAFEVAFGSQYRASAPLAESLLLATFSHFVCAPFMYVFAILRKPVSGLLGQILISLFPLGCLIGLSMYAIPLRHALSMYSIFTLIGALAMLALVYRGCIKFDKNRKKHNEAD